jgi:hypothetical protein
VWARRIAPILMRYKRSTQPLYLSARVTGGHGSSSERSATPTWSPPAKFAAKYLAPYLRELDIAVGGAR